jgi:Fur family ferric uptake transcriptional regulator
MAQATADSWREHAHEQLARAGHNRSAARAAVIELLATQPCALSAQEIEDALRAKRQRVGRATVYRALELLLDHGLIGRLEVGQGTARYEPIAPSGEHHHHLVCDRCGRLVAFDDAELEQAIQRLGQRLRMRVEDHDVLLRGACDRCQPSGDG